MEGYGAARVRTEGSRLMVYLWDAPGPAGRWSGVTGSLGTALDAAGERLISRCASSARVEAAWLAASARTLEPVYERTGQAWQASRGVGGGLQWEPRGTTSTCDAPMGASRSRR